jgi:FkbM family methyltransferase
MRLLETGVLSNLSVSRPRRVCRYIQLEGCSAAREMFVLLEKAKDIIKSVPFVYKSLRPIVAHYRRRGGETERLRQYCVLVPNFIAQPMFVKVGANDGITDDPISDLLLANDKWKGLLIEPVPFLFERLQKNFSDNKRFVLERVAIGANSRAATFYYVDEKAMDSIPNLPEWYGQLGSFDRNHITKHLGAVAPFIVESIVDVRPLPAVLEKNGIRDVHLLHIDAEGYDYEVLKTIDLANQAPAAILIEHKHLCVTDKVNLIELLREHEYSVDDCGGDYFAVHKSSPLARLAKDWAQSGLDKVAGRRLRL